VNSSGWPEEQVDIFREESINVVNVNLLDSEKK
jgi:hypothetical protein